MDGGEVIKSFLVGLGFDVDESSLAAFNKSIQSAAIKVTTLYGAITALAGSAAYAISKISDSFEELGFQFHTIAPQINKALILRAETLNAYAAAGINIRKTIAESLKLNLSLSKTKIVLDAIYKSVGSKFFGLLTKQSDAFRKKLYQNMPAIINVIEKLVGFIFKALDSVTKLGQIAADVFGRIADFFRPLYEYFTKIDDATEGWVGKILKLSAVFGALLLIFGPIGAAIAGLFLLFDDFETYQAGGKSLFNWGPVVPYINGIVDAGKVLVAVYKDVVDIILNVALAFYQAFKGDTHGELASWKSAGEGLVTVFTKLWDVFQGIDSAIASVVGKIEAPAFAAIGRFFGIGSGTDGQAPGVPGIQLNPAKHPGMDQPLGSTGSSSTKNITATLQTNINVNGAANASTVGQAAADQGSKNQGALIRNFGAAAQ
jgi:hypothetical protein